LIIKLHKKIILFKFYIHKLKYEYWFYKRIMLNKLIHIKNKFEYYWWRLKNITQLTQTTHLTFIQLWLSETIKDEISFGNLIKNFSLKKQLNSFSFCLF